MLVLELLVRGREEAAGAGGMLLGKAAGAHQTEALRSAPPEALEFLTRLGLKDQQLRLGTAVAKLDPPPA